MRASKSKCNSAELRELTPRHAAPTTGLAGWRFPLQGERAWLWMSEGSLREGSEGLRAERETRGQGHDGSS